MKEFRKRLWLEVALCASFLNLIHSNIAYSVDPKEDLNLVADASSMGSDTSQNAYTINFNNVSIIEFIRFASKITNLNFVFEEGDLQFTVTVVSEEPVSSKNVMSALAQVLRVHDLMLLEQENNVLIVKSTQVNQIPTIISGDLPDSEAGNAVLVTQVFRIKNANLNSVANIIRPMTSKGSLIEISNETRQLIVTDIITNVEKIASLLTSLDAPHTPLDVETFVVKNIAPLELITMTQQILIPFAEGNPLIFVPQIETNSIFIISTPYLIERAMAVMEDLDIPSQQAIVGRKAVPGKNTFIYTAVNRSATDLLTALEQINNELKLAVGPETPLEVAIDNAEIVKDTNSILFIVDPNTAISLKEIIASLDVPTAEGAPGQKAQNFFLYKLQNAQGEVVIEELKQIAEQIPPTSTQNQSVINAINSIQWVKSTNSLFITGPSDTIDQLKILIAEFDVTSVGPSSFLKVSFLIYKLQYVSSDQLTASLTNFAQQLKASTSEDKALVKTIEDMRYIKETNSILFIGPPEVLDKIDGLVKKFDSSEGAVGKGAQGFFLYKLQNADGNAIIEELKQIAEQIPQTNIQSQSVVNTINTIQWVKSTNSLLITGPADAIDQLKLLIAEFDITSIGKPSFLIFKPQHKTPQEMEADVETTTKDLEEAGLVDPDLLASLSSVKYVPATASLIFTGTSATLAKVKEMLDKIDSAETGSHVQQVGKVSFLIYKMQYVSGDQLMASLKNFAQQLKSSSIEDKALVKTIEDMRYIKETNSILFIGPTEVLDKIDGLVKKFDIASLAQAIAPERPAATYLVYSPKNLGGEALISILCDFEMNLQNSGVNDPNLFDAINNLKWIDKTSSLLISGDQASVTKVQELLLKFDVPGKESGVPSIESIDNTSFLVYKLQYHQGSDIRDALKQVGHSLAKAGNAAQTNLMDAINSLQWIQVTNSLLGTGQQDVLVKLKELIQNLDIPLRQVFIEILVIETTLSDTQNFGLMWGSQVQYMNKTILSTGNFPVPGGNGGATTTPVSVFSPLLHNINATTTPTGGPNGVPFTSGFDLGVIGDIIMHKGKSFISLGSLVNALQQDTNSTILLNPKIIAQDNQQSILFVGQNIPYTGAAVSTVGQATQQTTANIEYRDVGLSLTVTPILGDNNIVTIDIVSDISEQVGSPSGGTNVNGAQLTGITTNHNHMETRVQVPDQHFIALSGMLNESKSRYRSAIPCLGGLPVVGALFSENDRVASKTNVIIFMKPYIINSYEEYKQITEHQEWLYKDRAVLPVLKEEFDDALNTVKTPDDE